MKQLRFDATGKLELTAEAGKKRFRLYAYSGGVMRPKLAIRWNGPVVVDIAGMEVRQDDVPVHRDHDTTRPVGHTTTLQAESEIIAEGVFSVPSKDTDEIVQSGTDGFPWKASIGLSIGEYVEVQSGQTVTVNNREFDGPILVVTSSVLEEISFVTVPGDSEAKAEILARLSNGEANMPTFEEWVASLGLDPAGLSEEAKVVLQKQYAEQAEDMVAPPEMDAEQPKEMEAMDKPEAVAEMSEEEKAMAKKATASGKVDLRAQLAEEAQRAADINRLCAKFGNPQVSVSGKTVDLAAHAISEGWDLEKVELVHYRNEKLQATRNQRPQGPAIHSKSSNSLNMATLQAAMLMRGRADVESDKWSGRKFRDALKMDWLKASSNSDQKQQILEQAYKLRNASLLELTAHALRLSGRDVPLDRTDLLQAAFSTASVSNLYGATIGAKVLEGYNEIRDFSEGWTTESENPDMELHERIRMVSAQNLAYLPIGGEAAHATRSTLAETVRVERFARQMEIDEADLLGDNFGKLAETPRDFGLAAARVRPDLCANILLANPTLTATNRALTNTTDGNRFGSAALARATLSAAIAAMSKFKDGDASLNLAPSHILVPPDLADTAIQLTQSVRNATTSADAGEINPLAKYGVETVSEARLANGVIDPVTGTSRSGSTSTWWLVSREAHTIEFVYLAGAGRAPVVRTTQLVNGRFGLNIDVRHYIGAKALDWRGFIYNQSSAL
jgi:hypothetical protein